MNSMSIGRTKRVTRIALGMFIVLVFGAGMSIRGRETEDVLDGNFWKNQSLVDILPRWTRGAFDSTAGTFRTYRDRQWQPFNGSDLFPSMISRQIFGYAAAYLMGGDENHLRIARQTVDFLLNHAWDAEFGGWYDVLDQDGNPLERTKDSFVQVYAITGLVMYYIVTGDLVVLRAIERANRILETRSWDREWGGYVKKLERNLEIKTDIKDFASQVAPVSGYLFYLYLATGEKHYLEQIERVMAVVRKKMFDPESGWVLETFDRQWRYLPSVAADGTEINVGHNIETAWVFLRLFLSTGKREYLQVALALAEKLRSFGWNADTGVWYQAVGRRDPRVHSDFAYWWIQAYGNMFQLTLYRVTGDRKHLDDFCRGSGFWNSFFIDKDWGDTFLSVYLDGRIKDGTKANRFKASYHNLEHSLLNYLYLNLWVARKPAELHFLVAKRSQAMNLRPIPVEDRSIGIDRIRINEGDLGGGRAVAANDPSSGRRKNRVDGQTHRFGKRLRQVGNFADYASRGYFRPGSTISTSGIPEASNSFRRFRKAVSSPWTRRIFFNPFVWCKRSQAIIS